MVLTLGCGILVLQGTNTPVPSWIFLNIPSAIAIGTVLVAQQVAAEAAASETNMAIPASLSPFFRTVGQALGVVVGGAVFQNRLEQLLRQSDDTVVQIQANELANDFVQLIHTLRGPLDPHIKIEIRTAFDRSVQTIWWCLLAFAALSLLISLIIKDIPLRRKVAAAGAAPTEETKC